MDTLMAPQGMMMMAATSKENEPDANKVAKGMAVGVVSGSTGVDAWSDVSYEVAKDGRVHMTATAFFPDYSKVRIAGPDLTEANWMRGGDGMVLEVVMNSHGPSGELAATPPPSLTDKEVDDAVKQKRKEWQMSRPMMDHIYSALKIDTLFVLPGKVSEVNVFEKTDQGVRLVINGKKMLAAMDKMVADDAMMKEPIKAGKDPLKPGASDALQELVFGGKGPIRAKVSGDLKPVFDYKAEVEKAKAAQPAMLKKLGIDAPLQEK
jgi:hypothetical protein